MGERHWLFCVELLSRKFRSAENFGPGPIFSENCGPVGPILFETKGPCPEKKVRRFISYVHVVDISLRVMAEIEETVDDGSDCDDLVEEAYAYLAGLPKVRPGSGL